MIIGQEERLHSVASLAVQILESIIADPAGAQPLCATNWFAHSETFLIMDYGPYLFLDGFQSRSWPQNPRQNLATPM